MERISGYVIIVLDNYEFNCILEDTVFLKQQYADFAIEKAKKEDSEHEGSNYSYLRRFVNLKIES